MHHNLEMRAQGINNMEKFILTCVFIQQKIKLNNLKSCHFSKIIIDYFSVNVLINLFKYLELNTFLSFCLCEYLLILVNQFTKVLYFKSDKKSNLFFHVQFEVKIKYMY